LLNWIKDSIQELKEKKQARELSRAWEALSENFNNSGHSTDAKN